MELTIYVLYTILTFACFILALYLSAYGPVTRSADGGKYIETRDLKIIPIILFLFFSYIFAGSVAIESHNIEKTDCSAEINTATLNANITTYAYSDHCVTKHYDHSYLSHIYRSFQYVDVALAFILFIIWVYNGGLRTISTVFSGSRGSRR